MTYREEDSREQDHGPVWNRDRESSPMEEVVSNLIGITDEINQLMGTLRQKLDPVISPQLEDRAMVNKEMGGPVKPMSFHVNRLRCVVDDLRKAKHLGMMILEELEV